jgi:hypothetical protein
MLNEIKKISRYPVDRLKEIQQEMMPVLEHNYKIIKSLTPEQMLEKFK